MVELILIAQLSVELKRNSRDLSARVFDLSNPLDFQKFLMLLFY